MKAPRRPFEPDPGHAGEGTNTIMATSEFLAKLIGPLFLAVGTGMLVNRGTYQSVIAEGLRSALLFYLSGVMSLLGASRSC